MALAFDVASTAHADASVLTWPHACTGSNLVLVVGVSSWGRLPTSVTYNGVALTLIVIQDTDPNYYASLWYLTAPVTGTHDVVVTLDGSNPVIGGATSWTGADQSVPIGASGDATGTSTAPSVAISSATGEIVLDVLCSHRLDALTASGGADQIERWNDSYNYFSSRIMLGAGSSEAGAASVTMSWTLSVSVTWGIAAAAIKPLSAPANTTASEVWPIPARTEPLAIADGCTGELARALATVYPHLLAWKVVNGQFVWHDLGWLPAGAQLEALAAGNVPLGSGVDPGLTLFGVESHDSVVLTSLASSALGASQRRFPDPGGVAGSDSGVLYGSRMEFTNPHRLLRVRIWGEDFQQADTVRFAYRWDRKRWYSVGEIHGLPSVTNVQDNEGGLFLEWVLGFTDKYAWEPSVPVITRVDAEVEPIDLEARPEADSQVPGVE